MLKNNSLGLNPKDAQNYDFALRRSFFLGEMKLMLTGLDQ